MTPKSQALTAAKEKPTLILTPKPKPTLILTPKKPDPKKTKGSRYV